MCLCVFVCVCACVRVCVCLCVLLSALQARRYSCAELPALGVAEAAVPAGTQACTTLHHLLPRKPRVRMPARGAQVLHRALALAEAKAGLGRRPAMARIKRKASRSARADNEPSAIGRPCNGAAAFSWGHACACSRCHSCPTQHHSGSQQHRRSSPQYCRPKRQSRAFHSRRFAVLFSHQLAQALLRSTARSVPHQHQPRGSRQSRVLSPRTAERMLTRSR